jgi:hypothetical protein
MRGGPGNARDSLVVQGSTARSPERAPDACGCPGSFFAIRGPRVEFECSHGFTAIGAKPGGPWMGGD